MSGHIEEALGERPVMIVIRGATPGETVRLCERAWRMGVGAVEVTIQTPEALPSLRAAVEAGERSGHRVGAGSVHTVEQWDAAVGAGAAFTVAAATVPAVIERARTRGIDHVPGAATGTEVALARDAGATWVKAFPASLLTPAWVSAVRAPFPGTSFVATGGVDAGNAEAFLAAGCRAVAFGSSFERDDSAAVIAEILSR